MSEIFTGLSCYTANLATYLAADDPGAAARFADTVRLAVRTDGEPAFSHHSAPLDRLPDGTRLRYAAAEDVDETVAALDAELTAHHQVLVVTNNARLPWSPSFGTDSTAPHWLLVDGRDGDRWHVVDRFAGLLPTGEQLPHVGEVPTAHLLDAMAPARWSPVQERRCELAFGFPVTTPASGQQWLRRTPDDGATDDGNTAALPGTWRTGAESLEFLSRQFQDAPARMAVHLDDVWTAAGHRVFRYQWLRDDPTTADRHDVLDEAAHAWRQLPGALRFAVDSATRGRPRASLVDTTFRNLLDVESRLESYVESGREALRPSAGRTAR